MKCTASCKKYFLRGASACADCKKIEIDVNDSEAEMEAKLHRLDESLVEDLADAPAAEDDYQDDSVEEDEFGNVGSQIFGFDIERTVTIKQTIEIAADDIEEARERAKEAAEQINDESVEDFDNSTTEVIGEADLL